MELKDSQRKEEMLEVQMLGDFSLKYGDKVLSGEKLRGKQIWNLLEYIMVNRHKEISMDGLIQILWDDDDKIEDPANALKNLAYRLRVTLKNSLGLNDNDTIVFKHGAYVWNQNYFCSVDADQMEESYKAIQQDSLEKPQKIFHCKRIMELYKGNFMPQSSFKEWIIPLTVYYQRIFMDSVSRYCEILLEDREYNTVEEVCRRAIAVDPFVEVNHEILIKALIASKNHSKALEHYNYVNKLFYDELGVKPSDQITKLYHEALNKETAVEQDISLIKNDLKEELEACGAVYCNYEEFRMIYQLEARAALRSGKSVFLALLTVTGKNKKALPKKNLDVTFEKLKQSIIYALRKDDVVTRYGRTQFLLMLSNLTYENSSMVLNRIVRKINESGINDSVEVYGQLQTLDPIEMGGKYASI